MCKKRLFPKTVKVSNVMVRIEDSYDKKDYPILKDCISSDNNSTLVYEIIEVSRQIDLINKHIELVEFSQEIDSINEKLSKRSDYLQRYSLQ